MNPRLIKTSSIASLVALLLPTATSAAILINFQSTKVNDTTGSAIAIGTAFTTSTIASQTMNSGFEGQSTVFGGTGSADLGTDFAIRQSNVGFAPGRIYAADNSANPLRALLLWDKTVFLSGGAVNPVSFGGNNSLAIDTNTALQTSGGGWGYRFVVRDGASYYISGQGSGSDPSLTDFSAATWALFDPTAGGGSIDALAAAIGAFDTSAYQTRTFTDVTAVGFFANGTRTQFNNAVEVISFTVDATVVPEPGSFAALLMGGGLLARRRRR